MMTMTGAAAATAAGLVIPKAIPKQPGIVDTALAAEEAATRTMTTHARMSMAGGLAIRALMPRRLGAGGSTAASTSKKSRRPARRAGLLFVRLAGREWRPRAECLYE